MQWGLRQMVDSLRAEALSPRHAAVFAEATRRRAALAAFTRAADVLSALRNHSASDQWTSITRAVLAEQQEQPGPPWSALLLVAYYPMLSTLRHRIRAAVPDDEVDQLVVAAFLNTVAEDRLLSCRCVQLELRRLTERRVFAAVNREEFEMQSTVASRKLAALIDAAGPTNETTDTPSDATACAVRDERREQLIRHVDPGRAELVQTYGGCLRDWVRSQYPDATPDELERHYQRLKKARTRTRSYLRAISEVVEG